MKFFHLFIFIFLISSTLSNAQNTDTLDNSLKQILDKKDTSSVLLYVKLSGETIGKSATISLDYAYKALDLSKKIKYKVGEIKSLNSIGLCFQVLEEYSKAAECFIELSKKSETLNYKRGIIAGYTNLAHIYNLKFEYRAALSYLFKALKLAKDQNDETNTTVIITNIGGTYIELNLDSALLYGHEAYQLALSSKSDVLLSTACAYLGEAHSKLKNFDLALGYYKQAVGHLINMNNYYDLGTAYTMISLAFKNLNKIDSSIHYAKLGLSMSYKNQYYYNIINSSKILTDYYNTQNKDSFFKYSNIYLAAKDSTFSESNERKIQLVFANELFRQFEINTQNEKLEEEKKYNLKLWAIGVFITIFIIFLLTIRKKKVNKKIIIFLGILALLMIFEFANLYLHPLLEKMTKHNPIYILILMIVIGAILIPLHHKAEKFVLQRITKQTLLKRKYKRKNVKDSDQPTRNPGE